MHRQQFEIGTLDHHYISNYHSRYLDHITSKEESWGCRVIETALSTLIYVVQFAGSCPGQSHTLSCLKLKHNEIYLYTNKNHILFMGTNTMDSRVTRLNNWDFFGRSNMVNHLLLLKHGILMRGSKHESHGANTELRLFPQDWIWRRKLLISKS